MSRKVNKIIVSRAAYPEMPVPIRHQKCRCRFGTCLKWGAGAGAGQTQPAPEVPVPVPVLVGLNRHLRCRCWCRIYRCRCRCRIGTLFACNRHPQSVFLIFITGKNRLTTPFFTLDQFSDFFTGENRFSLHYFSTFLMFYMSNFFTPRAKCW